MPLRNINVKAKRLKQVLDVSLVAAGQRPAGAYMEFFRPGFHARRRVIFRVRAERDDDHIFPQPRAEQLCYVSKALLCNWTHGGAVGEKASDDRNAAFQ